jgi:hypothetical protein
MRTKRRVLLTVCCLLAATLGTQLALGQEPSQKPPAATQADEEIRLTRMLIDTERQARVTKAMDLTPGEMQRLWPFYREYRRATQKVGDRIVALINTYADHYQPLTDKAADTLLTEFVGIEQERAWLKAQSLPQCKQVLPPSKVAHFDQIGNTLDSTILAEMVQALPLAR